MWHPYHGSRRAVGFYMILHERQKRLGIGKVKNRKSLTRLPRCWFATLLGASWVKCETVPARGGEGETEGKGRPLEIGRW